MASSLGNEKKEVKIQSGSQKTKVNYCGKKLKNSNYNIYKYSMKDIYTEYFVFMKEAKNVYISSVDENTKPEISYSPCVVDDEKNVYDEKNDDSRRV